MRIVRKSSFTAVPWKNGRGITHEVLRYPEAGPRFLWRVSVARIEASGPFSDFSGYDRKMVLLQGGGVRLSFRGGAITDLGESGDLAEFNGAIATHCDLLSGPCTDLNLIVARSLRGVLRAWVQRLPDRYVLPVADAGKTLIFGIEGGLSVDSPVDERIRLDPWDLAVWDPATVRLGGQPTPAGISLSPASPAEAPLVFFATLDDNSS